MRIIWLSLASIAAAVAISLASAACGKSDDANDNGASPDAGGDVANVPEGSVGDAPGRNDGGLCNSEGFCFETPLPHGYPMTAVWSSAANDVWAIAYPGALLHYDGGAWSQVPLQMVGGEMRAIWGSGPNDIWVGGYEYRGAQRQLIFHYDGKAWTTSFTGPIQAPDFHHLNAIWGSGPSDVWAVGDTGTLMHYDGAAWSPKTPFTNARLSAIGGTSASDVWVLPQDFSQAESMVWHFDGTKWSSVSVGVGALTQSVWAAAPNDVWIAASQLESADGGVPPKPYTLRHFDGAGWTTVDAPLQLYSLWGTGPKDIWGSGSNGIVHYDGVSWTLVKTTETPASWIRGSGPNDIWAAGVSSSLYHFDGAAWSTLAPSSIVATGVSAIWPATPTDVWAAGAERDPTSANATASHGVILHRSGNAWQRTDIGTLPVPALSAMHGCAANDIWVVGDEGAALHFDGASWKSVATGTTSRLSAVWCGGPSNVWVGGRIDNNDGGYSTATMLHFDGTKWSTVPIDTYDVSSIYGLATDDVWAAAGSKPYHYDGLSWTLASDAGSGSYGSSTVWAGGKNDVWIGAAHYDGASWTAPPADGHVGITGVWRRSATEVWFLDAMGNVLRFDGTRLSQVTTLSVAASLNGIANDLWFVGRGGAIVHKQL